MEWKGRDWMGELIGAFSGGGLTDFLGLGRHDGQYLLTRWV